MPLQDTTLNIPVNTLEILNPALTIGSSLDGFIDAAKQCNPLSNLVLELAPANVSPAWGTLVTSDMVEGFQKAISSVASTVPSGTSELMRAMAEPLHDATQRMMADALSPMTRMFDSFDHMSGLQHSAQAIAPSPIIIAPIDNRYLVSAGRGQKHNKSDTRQYADLIDEVGELLHTVNTRLSEKWHGAWQTLQSDNPDRVSQCANSVREVLLQLLEELAPAGSFTKEEIEAEGQGKKVTKRMQVKKIFGKSSKGEVIDKFGGYVEELYSRLCGGTHDRSDGAHFNANYLKGLLIQLGGVIIDIFSTKSA